MKQKNASFGGFDYEEFVKPFRRKDRQLGYNPFFWYFYEQCQKKHALLAAQRMGLSIDDIKFDKNKAYIESNALISTNDLNELSQTVKRECPMSKVNGMMGNDDMQWIQSNNK